MMRGDVHWHEAQQSREYVTGTGYCTRTHQRYSRRVSAYAQRGERKYDENEDQMTKDPQRQDTRHSIQLSRRQLCDDAPS